MRGKIRLNARKNAETKIGFPIIIYLTQNNEDKEIITGYHSTKENWDKKNALPLKSHPNYSNLLNYLEVKKILLLKLIDSSNIKRISLNEAERLLLNIDNDIFYDQAIKKFSDNPIYVTALNSFNSFYKNYTFDYITKEVVIEYKDKLLKTPTLTGKRRSPNGVHTYLSKLNAIWNKLERKDNPFSGVRPKLQRTRNKDLSKNDILKIRNTCFLKNKFDGRSESNEHVNIYRYYWLLLFYLGGINMKVLANLRHDKNVFNGRVEFNRDKGGSDEFCSNKIFPEAKIILDRLQELTNCYPYFTPIYRQKNYKAFVKNFNDRFSKQCEILELEKKPTTYSARYSFINRAKQLELRKDVVEEIVGHKTNDQHSIYAGMFSDKIRDETHLKIISF